MPDNFPSAKSRPGTPRWTVGSLTSNSGGPKGATVLTAVRIAIPRSGLCRRHTAPLVPRPIGARGSPHPTSLSPLRKRPSPRQTSALLLGLVRNPSPSQQSFAQLLWFLPQLRRWWNGWTVDWMMRERRLAGRPGGSSAGNPSSIRFYDWNARGSAGSCVELPWSTGPVEGHIHRLKLIKRQMYGRAKLDLLQIHVLYAA